MQAERDAHHERPRADRVRPQPAHLLRRPAVLDHRVDDVYAPSAGPEPPTGTGAAGTGLLLGLLLLSLERGESSPLLPAGLCPPPAHFPAPRVKARNSTTRAAMREPAPTRRARSFSQPRPNRRTYGSESCEENDHHSESPPTSTRSATATTRRRLTVAPAARSAPAGASARPGRGAGRPRTRNPASRRPAAARGVPSRRGYPPPPAHPRRAWDRSPWR